MVRLIRAPPFRSSSVRWNVRIVPVRTKAGGTKAGPGRPDGEGDKERAHEQQVNTNVPALSDRQLFQEPEATPGECRQRDRQVIARSESLQAGQQNEQDREKSRHDPGPFRVPDERRKGKKKELDDGHCGVPFLGRKPRCPRIAALLMPVQASAAAGPHAESLKMPRKASPIWKIAIKRRASSKRPGAGSLVLERRTQSSASLTGVTAGPMQRAHCEEPTRSKGSHQRISRRFAC